jgi:hypothetical protein
MEALPAWHRILRQGGTALFLFLVPIVPSWGAGDIEFWHCSSYQETNPGCVRLPVNVDVFNKPNEILSLGAKNSFYNKRQLPVRRPAGESDIERMNLALTGLAG